MRRFLPLLIFLGGCFLPGTSFPQSQRRSMQDYDVKHYNLSIAFDIKEKSFRGDVEMTADVLSPITEYILHASNRTLTIDSVIHRGIKVDFTHSSDTLAIRFRSLQQPEFNLRVYYHGVSTFEGQFDDGGVLFSPGGHIATSSQPNFARNWWPSKDIPSDKATMSVSITIPDSLKAVSNGFLQNVERTDGWATYHWRTEYPIATYLVSVAVAPYSEWTETYTALDGSTMPIVYYAFPEDSDKARIDFANTTKILSYFAQTFGEYPFIKEKFGVAEVDGELTMENQTISHIQENMVTGDARFELTLTHEAAHHWWGNCITPASWHHTWLNEGFATYGEALYLEHRDGRSAYQRYINSMMSMPPGTYAGSVIGRSDTAFWDSFAPRVYYKGAIILHMLRCMLGDSLFFTAMCDYTNDPRFRYANAQTDDFIDVCERTSGQNLRWFFDQWVYASADSIDRPELVYDWQPINGNSLYHVRLEIEQTQGSRPLYRLPLSISVLTSDSVLTFDVVDSLARQTFTFIVPSKPESLAIDPENTVFKTVRKKEEL